MRWVAIVLLATLSSALPNTALAQASGGAVRYVNPMGTLLPWVHGQQMEKELEIVADQKEKLAKLRAEATKEMRALYATANDGDRQQWRQKYNELSAKMAEDNDRKTKDILLPHQVRRLRQIALQMKLASTGYGSTAGLASAEVADELGITEEQMMRLKEKEKEIAAEIRRKTQEFYKQLREEARDELLGELTERQRRKLDELTGEKFEWQPAQGRQAAAGRANVKPSDGAKNGETPKP